MKISWNKHRLQLKETFSIAYGSYDFRDSLLVTLTQDKQTGYGECVAINYYGIDLADFELKLKEIQNQLERFAIVTPAEFYIFLSSLQLHSFLRSALDCAYWDLSGKLEGKTFDGLNDSSFFGMPESSFTISIDSVDIQLKKIKESPWQKFKVKCNGLDRNNVFRLLESGKEIALDANASFSPQDCVFLQNHPLSEGFTYIEQPLPVGEYQVLSKEGFAKWMADEDCLDLSYLEKLQPHYSAINIKLMKCGGITPALELIEEAKNHNYKVMIGCMTESSVGISAGIAVASLCDYADLDGANLISNDYAKGSIVENGILVPNRQPGLGIEMIS